MWKEQSLSATYNQPTSKPATVSMGTVSDIGSEIHLDRSGSVRTFLIYLIAKLSWSVRGYWDDHSLVATDLKYYLGDLGN